MSNYSTKINLKGAAGVDISNIVAKSDLEYEVYEIEVDRLKTVPAYLSVIDNYFVKTLRTIN